MKLICPTITKTLTLDVTLHFRFVQRTDQDDYIDIVRGQGCHSHVGKQGGRQEISLGDYCAGNVGTPIHEIMHALGNLIIFCFKKHLDHFYSTIRQYILEMSYQLDY